jgi:ubiquitin thioesterase OTU1
MKSVTHHPLCHTILKAILAEHYQAELSVTDIQTGRADVYGEGQGYTRRGHILYSGLHFDVAVSRPGGEGGGGGFKRVFAPEDGGASAGVTVLATSLRSKGAFSDSNTMRLKCMVLAFGTMDSVAKRRSLFVQSVCTRGCHL